MPDATTKADRTRTQTTDVRDVSGVNSSAARPLDACYGQIGISAVAAAARYQGVAKNPAYAPASNDWRHQYVEEPA
jgi:hypothetical protein